MIESIKPTCIHLHLCEFVLSCMFFISVTHLIIPLVILNRLLQTKWSPGEESRKNKAEDEKPKKWWWNNEGEMKKRRRKDGWQKTKMKWRGWNRETIEISSGNLLYDHGYECITCRREGGGEKELTSGSTIGGEEEGRGRGREEKEKLRERWEWREKEKKQTDMVEGGRQREKERVDTRKLKVILPPSLPLRNVEWFIPRSMWSQRCILSPSMHHTHTHTHSVSLSSLTIRLCVLLSSNQIE